MTERRTPYRMRSRRPLEPRAPVRRLAALPPGDERAIAERLLLDLTAYYGVQGWRGVDGVLAGRCRITIQALLGALEAAQRRRETAGTETAAPTGAAVERADPAEASSAALPLPRPRALGDCVAAHCQYSPEHATSETEGSAP
jgi:hypothetical protein